MNFKSSPERGFRIFGSDGAEERICDHVRVTAFCTSEGTHDKFAEIELWDRVAKDLLTIRVSFAILHSHGELIKLLSSKGLIPPRDVKTRKLLTELLAKTDPKNRKHLVRKVGLYGRSTLVLPSTTLGSAINGYIYLYDYDPERPPKVDLSCQGTLAEWKQHVASPGGRSSRIVAAVSAAIAAIVLPVAGAKAEENFGLHFFAPTSLGKSTLLHVARSVAGYAGEGSFHDWNNTDMGFEEIACAANCSALITDESQMVDSQDSSVVLASRRRAYQFVQGRTKGRSERYQKEGRWCGILLSAGEDSFTSLAARVHNPRKGGEVHRIIDIPAIAEPTRAELGVFEAIPTKFRSSAEAADALKEACGQFYGQPLRAFAKRWLEESTSASTLYQKRKAYFLKNTLATGLGGWERRFCERFAVMYAAASIASDWSILPWSRKKIRLALKRCYRAARGTLGNTLPEPSKLAGDLQHRISQVISAGQQSMKTVMVQAAGERHPARILVRGRQLETWFPTLANRDALLSYLEGQGLLLRAPSRHARTVQVRIGGKRLDFYCFSKKLLASNSAKPGK